MTPLELGGRDELPYIEGFQEFGYLDACNVLLQRRQDRLERCHLTQYTVGIPLYDDQLVLPRSLVLLVEPRFSTRMILLQIWLTCRTYVASSPANEDCQLGDNTIGVYVATAVSVHKSSCSTPYFPGAFGTGCSPRFGATSPLPFPVPMPATFTSVCRGSMLFLCTIERPTFAPQHAHHGSPLVQNGANMYIAGAFLYCSCCRPPVGSLFEYCTYIRHM